VSKRNLVEELAWQAQRRAHRAVHKRQLIAEVARRTSLTQAQVREALDGILEFVAEAMAEGNAVTLVGFGRFEACKHRPRVVHGRDGRTYRVERRLVPVFRPYPSLRQQVQERAAEKKSAGDE
jgi:DNA-binding protein HU-beta